MAVALKPPLRDSKPPEAKPRFSKKLLEIREVKTPAERREYDRVLFKAFEDRYERAAEQISEYDSYFQNHRRFIACLREDEPGRVIGTGMLAQKRDGGRHAILRLAVDEEFRERGASREMLAAITEEAKAMGIKELMTYCFTEMIKRFQRAGYTMVEQLPRRKCTKQNSWELVKKLE